MNVLIALLFFILGLNSALTTSNVLNKTILSKTKTV